MDDMGLFVLGYQMGKKKGGSPANPTEQLKLIDQAPALATIDLGSWSIKIKKVDDLTQDRYSTWRYDGSSSTWYTDHTISYALIAVCVYCGTKLKWVIPSYSWLLLQDRYRYDSMGEGVIHFKYNQVRWGAADVDENDNIVNFTENIIRIDSITPTFPKSTSLYADTAITLTYKYDQQVINYLYDGSIDNISYNRNLTQTTRYNLWYFDSSFTVDPKNIKNDYADFCDAIMAYVNQ